MTHDPKCPFTDLPNVTPLKLEPGATYVIEVDRQITHDQAVKLKAKLHELTQANFVILGEGVTLKVVD